MRRALAALLVVLGLVAVGLGIASATVWRAADTVTATLDQPDTPVVLLRPGVTGMANPDSVRVTATAPSPDAPVVLALAPADDVDAWVGPAAHLDVVGLASWTELATERIDGEPSVPDPAGADLWVEEITGTGEVVADLVPDPGQVVLLAATDGVQPAPRVALTWSVEVSTPYLVPLLVGGTLIALVGLGVLVWDLLVRREVNARAAARQQRATADVTSTTTMPAIDSVQEPPVPRLTRRQLRDRDRSQRTSDPRSAPDGPIATTAGMVGAGIVPAAIDPERHRALRYLPLDEQDWTLDPDLAEAGPARGSAVVPGVPDAGRHRATRGDAWRTLWDVEEEER